MPPRKLAIVVGAGFSAALTSGSSPLVGNGVLPLLTNLGDELLAFAVRLTPEMRAEIPFSERIFSEAVATLTENARRPVDARFDFEHLVSLVAIRRSLFTGAFAENAPSLPSGSNPAVLRCLLALLALLVASRLGLTPTLRANRNYWYAVQDPGRVAAVQEGIRTLCRRHEVTFISFNYDGLVEAFLDVVLGSASRSGSVPDFLYLPELSHGVPVVMPEHVYFRQDTRDLTNLSNLTRVLKPHGSIHFFRLRTAIEGLLHTAQIVALHPRLDLRFNPATMQRDIPFGSFWQFADPVPFIVPPLINKEGLLSTDYFSEILRLSVSAIHDANAVVSLGFSLPPSDLHVCAAFEVAQWSDKPLGLCYLNSNGDATPQNWRRVAHGSSISVLSDRGMPLSTPADISQFWESLGDFAESPAT